MLKKSCKISRFKIFYGLFGMIKLSPEHIYLNQSAVDKAQALQLLSDILVKDGLTTVDYLQGLQQREQQSSTYLGQGIAIPHGTPESRDAILQTGVRFVHFPQGVQWSDENVVYLAVVISAKSDEHLTILQQLTRLLSDDVGEKIRQIQSTEDVMTLFNQPTKYCYLHEDLIIETSLHDIDDALYQLNQVLKQHQCVSSGFVQGLHLSSAIQLDEQVYCVTGQHSVLKPAVAVLKFSQPIEYQNKKIAVLLCVASHQQMDLMRLSTLMDTVLQASFVSLSIQDIAQQFGIETLFDWQHQSVQLFNEHGLHARPATFLSQLCQKYTGEIKVSLEHGQAVSAKSLTKLLSLGAVKGQTLTFFAEPNSEIEQHLTEVIQAVKDGLGEDVQTIQHQADTVASTVTVNTDKKIITLLDDTRYTGISASAGIAMGAIYQPTQQHYDYQQFSQNKTQEQTRLNQAIKQVKQDLQQLIAQAETTSIADIFKAHLAMLSDDAILDDVAQAIQTGLTAEYAWHQQISTLSEQQAKLSNRLLAERADDLRDVGQRVLAVLCGATTEQRPNEAYILVKHDLMPSDVARLDKQYVKGILTAVGGASSHSAIVARALGIPAIVGAGEAILNITSGRQVLLDGESGEFFINPNPQRIEQAMQRQQQEQQLRLEAEQACLQPAITQDHHQVEIAVNLGDVRDADSAVVKGAEAVGLLRTELLFMSHSAVPSEAVQEQEYRTILDALDGRPLVVRTLDVGGDKPLPYLPMASEENPFLGVRGIRLSLRQPELLAQQLRALVKSADGRSLRIMFPMIGRVEEWREAKKICDEIIQQYADEKTKQNIQVGMMIEVPSAVFLAPILAKEVDFFSIGTNDLTQYVMAIDRGHPELSQDADGLHPSVLKCIQQTVQAAHAHGKWVGVCGELAGERQAVPILLGLDVDELSMSASRIAMVKAQIRQLNMQECKALAKQALECESAGAVRALVDNI